MILVISGRTASGKTTLARALAESVSGTVGSFGNYVRTLALEDGRALDRPSLQAVGQTAVEANPSVYLMDFLHWLSPPENGILVLEGLRHASVRDALRSYANARGTEIWFVHIEADDRCRVERLHARGDDDEVIASHEAHPSEADVDDRLKDEADLRLQGSNETSTMVAELRQLLKLDDLTL